LATARPTPDAAPVIRAFLPEEKTEVDIFVAIGYDG
jgi:hypothetical protein